MRRDEYKIFCGRVVHLTSTKGQFKPFINDSNTLEECIVKFTQLLNDEFKNCLFMDEHAFDFASKLTLSSINNDELIPLDTFENTATSYYEFFHKLYHSFEKLE